VEDYIRIRIAEECKFVLEKDLTMREAEKYFGLSKTTIHRDVHQLSWDVDRELAEKMQVMLRRHKSEGIIKGGEIAKERWRRIKEEKNNESC
jgi:putative DeoR family transcriptional regulator, stage III sporulation protein D